jgi:UDP-glucose 4-epimerase
MRILITGGAGFIGSHLADALLQQGHDITIWDNFSTGKRENVPHNAHFVEVDILEPAQYQALIDGQFEAVFHLAAQLDVRRSVIDPVYDAEVNIVATVRLLEAAAHSTVKHFIFASSGGTIYGELDYTPADELHPIRPLSPYGISKATVEHYLAFYAQVYGLRYVSLRYANVYGPRQNPHGEAGVIAIFAQKLLQGQQPIINGEGLQTRDYVHVSDVVQANLLALDYPESGCFNVGTGVETNVCQLFDAINAALSSPAQRQHGPSKDGEVQRSVLSYAKLQQAMNWQPQYAITEGLANTIEWFKTQYGPL